MATYNWYDDDEEKKKKDELNSSIQSVQDGWNSANKGWQPAQNDAASTGRSLGIFAGDAGQQGQDGNYLMSDEKAQADENKRRQDEAEAAARAQAAAAAAAAAQAQAAAAAQAAQAQAAQSQPQLSDFDKAQMQAAAQAQASASQLKQRKYAAPQKDEGLLGFIKMLGAGFQQSIGSVADAAVQGGHVLNYLRDRAMGVDENTAAKNLWQSGESMRKKIHDIKDIAGNNLVGVSGADEAAGRIAAGQGTVRDFSTVGGQGLQVGLDATQFINPAGNIAKGASVVKNAGRFAELRPVLIQAGKEAGMNGVLTGVATTGRTYGNTGDLGTAIQSGVGDATLAGTSQFGLGLGSNLVGRGVSRVRNGFTKELADDISAGAKSELPGSLTKKADDISTRVDSDPNVSSFDKILKEKTEGLPTNSVEGKVDVEGRISERVPERISEPQTQQIPSVQDRGSNTPQGLREDLPQLTSAERVNLPDNSQVGSVKAKEDLDKLLEGTPSLKEEKPLQIPGQNESPVKLQIPGQNESPIKLQIPGQNKEVVKDILGKDLKPLTSVQKRALREAKSGSTQAEEALINAKLNQAEKAVPTKSLPDGMVPEQSSGSGSGSGIGMKELAKRAVTGSAAPTDFKKALAQASGLSRDAELPIGDILGEAKLSKKMKERYSEKYAEMEKIIDRQNQIQKEHRKLVRNDNLADASGLTKEWSSLERQKGAIATELNAMNRLADSRQSLGHKAAYVTENLVSMKNANQLVSAPGIERNLLQDIMGTAETFAKNPIRSARALKNGGNVYGSALHSAVDNWKNFRPVSVTDGAKRFVGNTLETAMVPVTGTSNLGKAPIREALAEASLKMAGKNPTRQEIVNFSRMMDADTEALVNVLNGVHNAMTNRRQADKAIRAWHELMATGSDAARNRLHALAERQQTLAQKLVQGFEAGGTPKQRIAAALTEAALPYARVATNTAINAAYRLVPNKTLIDEVLSVTRTRPQNLAALIKNTAVDYGVVGVVAGLVGSGNIIYNNGDKTNQPRGILIRVGKDEYVPIRATNIEPEIAGAYTAVKIAQGKMTAKEAMAAISDSLPYVSSTDNLVTAGKSWLNGEGEEGDNMYQAKNYAVSNIKSLVPFSNNGIQPWLAGKKGILEGNILKGDSLNAKSSYDKDFGKWVTNSIRQAYDPWFRETLPDSRDAAGRVRTVDNQGAIIHKQINDPASAEFNSRIDDLVKYGKENGLGKDIREMFGTYNTGKDNNFRSVHNAITFLDAENGKPDNAKKLEKNGKLADLSRQIKDGFFGDSGSELLKLDGKELRSDASIPNKSGSKNTQLPISMQSVRNAIAQTDLPADQRGILYDISTQKNNLYGMLKSKQISYEEYNTAKTNLTTEENNILLQSPSYQKLNNFMHTLNNSGFFDEGGLGSTKSGQTYLWNALNAMLGSKGTTPAAEYKDENGINGKGYFMPYGRRGFFGFGGGRRGSGFGASDKTGNRGDAGLQWGAVKGRSMENVGMGKYTPVSIKTTVNGRIKRNKTQNYDGRSI